MDYKNDKLDTTIKNVTEYQILATAVNVGKILLESGAETYRVEESIKKICMHYGVKTNPFVILTCIMCSAKNSKGEIFSLIERIKNRTTDLDKVDKISKVVSNIKKYSYEELLKEIFKISRKKGYTNIQQLVAYYGGAAFFSILFNGNIRDFFASGIAGVILFLWIKIAEFVKINQYFKLTVGGSICSMVVYLLMKMGIISVVSVSIISSFMLMVPGISFTNGIRDLIAGDFVAGVSRGTEAILIAASLAAGSGFTIYVLMKIGGI